MIKYTPYNKLSKRARRELNKRHRTGWGPLNPVTRYAGHPKAYHRSKEKLITRKEEPC